MKEVVVDRGYRGRKEVDGVKITLPSVPLKRDNRYQRDKKRKKCRRRAAIEPIIGHLKSDYRLSRNYLKGKLGDSMNVMMAAAAWNFRKWILAFFGPKTGITARILGGLAVLKVVTVQLWMRITTTNILRFDGPSQIRF